MMKQSQKMLFDLVQSDLSQNLLTVTNIRQYLIKSLTDRIDSITLWVADQFFRDSRLTKGKLIKI